MTASARYVAASQRLRDAEERCRALAEVKERTERQIKDLIEDVEELQGRINRAVVEAGVARRDANALGQEVLA